MFDEIKKKTWDKNYLNSRFLYRELDERWINLVFSCISLLHLDLQVLSNKTLINSKFHQWQNIIETTCISEARLTQTGGERGHHVIIWHLQCPTLQICEDGEQKICLLWSRAPHSLLCGWSLWIIHSESHRHMQWKSVGEYHTKDGILHYVRCARRTHRPHVM